MSLPNAAGTPGSTGQNGVKTEPNYVKQEAGIKQEPGTAGNGAPVPNYNGVDNKTSVAASRAAQQLQLQYGIRAAGSINAIQDRMGQQQPQQPQQQQGQQPPAGNSSISNGQTDGPGDDDDEIGRAHV